MKKYLVLVPEWDYEFIGDGGDVHRGLKDRIVRAENADDAIYKKVFENGGYEEITEHAIELMESAIAIEVASDTVYKFTKDLDKALQERKAKDQEKLELEQLRKLKAKYEK
jgi:hypothetical protein